MARFSFSILPLAGTYAAPVGSDSLLDGRLLPAEVAFVRADVSGGDSGGHSGGSEVRIEASDALTPIFTIASGSPHTSYRGITFAGRLLFNVSSTASSHSIAGCSFVSAAVGGHEPTSTGGGISVQSGRLLITGSSFSGLRATDEGGAIALRTSHAAVRVEATRFSANSARLGGAAYVGGGGRLELSSCTFEGNNATELGGGLYVTNGTVILSNTTNFHETNTAVTGASYYLAPTAGVEVLYALPAPAARWVTNTFICKVYTLPCHEVECTPAPLPSSQQPCDMLRFPELEGLVVARMSGAYEEVFPFECNPGRFGSSDPVHQQARACARPSVCMRPSVRPSVHPHTSASDHCCCVPFIA